MQHRYKIQHSTVTAPHTLNNTVTKGLNQMAPPARTISVALDMSKDFLHNNHAHTNQKADTDKHALSSKKTALRDAKLTQYNKLWKPHIHTTYILN